MKKTIKVRFIGLLLVSVSLFTWFWMLGGFANFFSDLIEAQPDNSLLVKWLDPGLLSIPILSSLIMGFLGVMSFFWSDKPE